MTTAVKIHQLPAAKSGKYAVQRLMFGTRPIDYLHAWDSVFGCSFASARMAMVFGDKDEAVRAAMKAFRAVPATIDGDGLGYDVVILS